MYFVFSLPFSHCRIQKITRQHQLRLSATSRSSLTIHFIKMCEITFFFSFFFNGAKLNFNLDYDFSPSNFSILITIFWFFVFLKLCLFSPDFSIMVFMTHLNS